jgi:hypothetical protein
MQVYLEATELHAPPPHIYAIAENARRALLLAEVSARAHVLLTSAASCSTCFADVSSFLLEVLCVR